MVAFLSVAFLSKLIIGSNISVDVDPILPPSLTAHINVGLSSQLDVPGFVDVTATLYRDTNSRTSRRNATIVSIVWGAGNSHGSKTLAQALKLVDLTINRSTFDGGEHPDLVLFPEAFLYNGSNAEYLDSSLMEANGGIVGAMQKKAAELSIYVVCPIYELPHSGASQQGPTFNTAVLIDRRGKLVGKYRKHFPTTTEIDSAVIPGQEVPTFDLDFGRVAILTCWDFNFPEVWQAVGAMGADLVLWPAAAKGAENVQGHALNSNYYIASNGAGQFYDRVGRDMQDLDRQTVLSANITLAGEALPIQLTKATLDMDSAVIFYGGPSTKRNKINNFLSTHAANIKVEWTSDISKLHLIRLVRPGPKSLHALLDEAGIEIRQQEEARNRQIINAARRRQRDV